MLKFLGFNFPLVLLFSVLGIKDYKFSLNNSDSYHIANKPIMMENLLVHDLLAEDKFMDELDKHLKNIFDPIWNACGFSGSLNYNASGEWIKNN